MLIATYIGLFYFYSAPAIRRFCDLHMARRQLCNITKEDTITDQFLNLMYTMKRRDAGLKFAILAKIIKVDSSHEFSFI